MGMSRMRGSRRVLGFVAVGLVASLITSCSSSAPEAQSGSSGTTSTSSTPPPKPVVLTVSAQMVIGFLLALLFAKQFPLRRYLLILVLTPMMLSFVAVGAFFRYYYDPTFGLVSQIANLFTDENFVLVSSTPGAIAAIRCGPPGSISIRRYQLVRL